MNRFRTHLLFVGCTALALAALPTPAEASCGLEYCELPSPALSGKSAKHTTLSILPSVVGYSLQAESGSYIESRMRLDTSYFRQWKFGLWVSPVLVLAPEESRRGITNPVFFSERSFSVNDSITLSTAMQLEVPLGSSEAGIASDHFELLPYLGARYQSSRFLLQWNVGLAFAIGAHEHDHMHAPGEEHEAPLVVNPHEDREAMMRLAFSMPLRKDTLRPGIQINARKTLQDNSQQFVTGSLTTTYAIHQALQLVANAEFPLSSEKRFDWRGGAGLQYAF